MSVKVEGGGGGVVHYEVETSIWGRGIVVYEVNEVYVYIPAELSAAGFELKIAGCVRIADKNDQFHLIWNPIDLTQQDVACLYSAQADGWTVIEEFGLDRFNSYAVEPPELIEAQELKYPDRDYQVRNLDMPEPILQEGRSPTGGQQREEEAMAGKRSSQDGDTRIMGIVSHPLRAPMQPVRSEAVNFPLSRLHSVRENTTRRSLTFFLMDGLELPTLYFHDGGTNGLLQAMNRYTYLNSDPKDPTLYRSGEYNKKDKPHTLTGHEHPPLPRNKGIEHIVHGVVSGAVSNVIGITRAVRQHLLPDKLMDVRPGSEDNEDIEETIQTVACSDMKASPQRGKATEIDPDASLITDFQIITDIRGKLPPRPPTLPRQLPVTLKEWESFRDGEGRISPANEKRFRARVFAGGMEGAVRKEAWRYLLNYFPFNITDLERMDVRRRKEKEYWSMKQQWQVFTPEQEERFAAWREAKAIINKDVLRTDRDNVNYSHKDSHKLIQLEDILRTHVMYNFDLGYVQGMSDLLAPILVVMDNEVDAFWCFAGYMDMVGHYFELTQAGMRTRLKQLRALLNVSDPTLYQFLKDKEANNLYFCFRWLLVDFKREFTYDDIMRLWEVLWTKYLSPDYSLFIALAIFDLQRDNLNNPQNDFSDILQHINGLAKMIPLEPVLELAEVLCHQLGTCPSLPEDLQTLVVRPMPKRLETIPETDTIICDPDSSAVPTES